MERKRQDVVFRRVRGRIVPIKRKKGQSRKAPKRFDPTRRSRSQKRKDRITGFSLLGSGLLGAGATGYASGRLFRKGAAVGQEIQSLTMGADIVNRMRGVDPRLQRDVSRNMLGLAGRRLPKFGRTMATSKAGLALAGSSLLFGGVAGEGVTRLFQSTQQKEIGSGEAIGSAIVGLGVGKVVEKSFKKGVGKKLLKRILTKGRI
jgi:hypothetical protein